jgi:hypothetical protein
MKETRRYGRRHGQQTTRRRDDAADFLENENGTDEDFAFI